MRYFPLFHDMDGCSVLIVGGGSVAARKIALLKKTPAQITVVAPDVDERVSEQLSSSDRLIQREFNDADIAGMALVVAATNDARTQQRVSEQARAAAIPVNVVDQPDLCTVVFPSIVDRSPLVIALSSAGQAPVLLRRLREQLEALIPQGVGRLAAFAGRQRNRVKKQLQPEARRRFWEYFFDSSVASGVQSRRASDTHSERAFDELLTSFSDGKSTADNNAGEVYIVGAGPGDPDLLTLRALQLMQQADVVLFDNLVSELVMERCRRDAERVRVGKLGRGPSTSQEKIHEVMLEYAQRGMRVLRLKGGDPFIFGRGGEELQTLVAADIPFQVVPGITAASGCASYAGIPLTHRDHAQSVRFVTGHRRSGVLNLDWPELARAEQTLVFYMGLGGVTEICARLIEHGRHAHTPAALIEKGTLPEQKVYLSSLSGLPDLLQTHAQNVSRPTLIVVGEVVALARELNMAPLIQR